MISSAASTQQARGKLPTVVDKLSEPSTRYALIIGVSQYDEESNVNSISGPDKDAEELSKALRNYAGFPEQNIITLASDKPEPLKPTYTNIVSAITRIKSMVPKEGLLLLAFSGHGIVSEGETYLLPSNVRVYGDDDSSLAATSFSVSGIKRLLARKSIQQVIILLDACRDNTEQSKGGGATRLTTKAVATLNLDDLNKDIQAYAVVYATKVGFSSYVDRDKQQSYFSGAVVDGLSGKAANEDGEVTLGGLIKYLQATVPPRVKSARGLDQIPWANIEGYRPNELVLAKVERAVTAAHSELFSGSMMLVTPDGREVYVASAEAGGVFVFSTTGGAPQFIDLSPAKPGEMVMAARQGQIYIVDYAANAVMIVDAATHQVAGRIPAGETPRALAITPDENTLYIANEQPAPQGTISVVDLATRKTTAMISGVNCPEALAMTPDGKRLYVASQCGFEQDPVFVVSTQTNKVIKEFRGYAVGVKLILTRDGGKVFVATEGYDGADEQGRPVRRPNRLSVIDTRTEERHTLQLPAGSAPLKVDFFAVTPDNRYVLAVGASKLLVIDSGTDEVIEEKSFGTRAAGIAVGRAASSTAPVCYVWLPEQRRLFITGLSGILGSRAQHPTARPY